MVTQITNGVKISVETSFLPGYTNSDREHFVFSYQITIENNSEYTIQLLRRHWFIFDSIGELREVEGEGVIGQQPVLEPGQLHTYVSGCNLRSNMGTMKGTYLMERQIDGHNFEVLIPEFQLVAPYILN
ncbi:MAG: Co2+/Mg2+ efflux protein ApaG [Cytophagales bacterium]